MANNSVRIIAEVGSTHMADRDIIKRGIEDLCDAGADSVKFQLFENTDVYTRSGNIWLSPELFYFAVGVARANGMDISASVFDDDSLDVLLRAEPKWVKFAYSRKEDEVGIRRVIHENLEPIVSCDILTVDKVPEQATKLYCIPEYPVRYNPRFEGIFEKFDGFSDHTLGYDVTLEAVSMGARVIEKHIRLVDKGCPDCAFALSLSQFRDMIKAIRNGERVYRT